MKRLKYIKRIFESVKYIDPIEVGDMSIRLINPDGNEVTVDMEEDGEWEEWVEPPYVKAVSVSGDDGKYLYTTSAIGDPNSGYEIDSNDHIEVELISDVQHQKNIKSNRSLELLKKSKNEQKNDLKKSKHTESKLIKEKLLKKQHSSIYLEHLQRGLSDHSNYGIVKVLIHEREWDTDKIEYSYIEKYKIPIPDYVDLSDPNYAQLLDIMGLEFDPEEIFRSANILKTRDYKYLEFENPSKYLEIDPDRFLDRAPFYARVSLYTDGE